MSKFGNDPDEQERQAVGRAFEDPNSADDLRLGKAFDHTTSAARKKHAPLSDSIHKPRNSRFIYWLVLGVAVVFLLVLLLGYLPRRARDKETARRAEQQRNALPVVLALKVTRAKSKGGLVIPGTTTPLEEAYVYGRANGYLKRRLVDIGDRVRKGQLMAIIDAPDLDEQVDQAREQVRQAEAQVVQQQSQLALAKVTVDRYRVLVGRGVLPRQTGDQAEANYETAVANVAASQRNLEAFQANLGHVIALQSFERVTAPFDGIVTQRNVDVGALISAAGSGSGATPAMMTQPGTGTGAGVTNTSGTSGSQATFASPSTGGAQGGALFSVAQVDRLRILVSVPEGYAAMIARGQRATVSFQEFPTRQFTGNVTRTASAIDLNTRTLLVEVQVDNRAGTLMAGMYAVVTFSQNAIGPDSGHAESQSLAQGPILIPGDAIAIRHDRPSVAVIDPDGTVRLTPVELGRDYGSVTEIVSGLSEGQIVSSTFTDDIRDGVKVKVQMDQSAEQQAFPKPSTQPQPPGGSTQYARPAIVDDNMQGQAAKPQQRSGAKQLDDSGSKP